VAKKASGLQKIDAAAVRVIGRQGLARASTRQIARAAGVSEGLIFRYYKTKLDLGTRLFQRHYLDILARLKEEGARHNDPLGMLRGVAKSFYRWFDDNGDVARFLLKTHQEFLDKGDQEEGFLFLAGVALKRILGEALFLLFPSDIIASMLVGAFLQVCVECTHGQVKGPLAPRMEPVIDAMVGLLSRLAPGGEGKAAKGSKKPPA
jgi:AcrR family transcriptional regulator